MTREEHDRIKGMFASRSRDFWTSESGEFEGRAWKRYLDKTVIRRINDHDMCEAFSNKKEGTVIIEDPREDFIWFLIPEGFALKCLVLGELPPRYSRKPKAKG